MCLSSGVLPQSDRDWVRSEESSGYELFSVKKDVSSTVRPSSERSETSFL